MSKFQFIVAVASLALGVCATQADIILSADPGYTAGAAMFTLDPELYAPAARNVAAARQLRQTFQLDTDVDVGQIVTSLVIGSGGVNGGLVIDIYEVEDVLAGTFTPGTLVHTFTIPTNSPLPVTSQQIAFTFTGGDIFTLAQRNAGTQGYGFEISNADDLTNVGAWRHSNDGTDHYTTGVFYVEGGTIPNAARDMGIAFYAVPEPSVAMLALCGLVVVRFIRRRRS